MRGKMIKDDNGKYMKLDNIKSISDPKGFLIKNSSTERSVYKTKKP